MDESVPVRSRYVSESYKEEDAEHLSSTIQQRLSICRVGGARIMWVGLGLSKMSEAWIDHVMVVGGAWMSSPLFPPRMSYSRRSIASCVALRAARLPWTSSSRS